MKRRINFLHSGLILPVILILMTFYQAYAQENITITTYYPSPQGSYNQLQANSLGVGDTNANGSLDTGDIPTTAGDVWIAGNLGIGTTNPVARLDAGGGIRVGNDTGACNAGRAGTVRFRAGVLEYCDGANWIQVVAGDCPAGFVDTGYGYCIQRNENSPLNWFAASDFCADNFSARMCKISEWYNACANTAGLNNMVGNMEWTDAWDYYASSNPDYGRAIVMGLTSCNRIHYFATDSIGEAGPSNNPNAFRCCRDK